MSGAIFTNRGSSTGVRGVGLSMLDNLFAAWRIESQMGQVRFLLSVIAVFATADLIRFRLRRGLARADDTNQICTLDGNPIMKRNDEYSK